MKTNLVLLLYDKLMNDEQVVRRDFCAEHGISERTFYRYINDIEGHLLRSGRNLHVMVQEPKGEYFIN